MPHFFIKSNQIQNDIITVLDKELLRHLVNSLRVRLGEELKFIDENEIQYETVVVALEHKALSAQVKKSYQSQRKLPYDIFLAQAVLKPEAQLELISGAVQCGVRKIFPVVSDRCAVSRKTFENKLSKWQKVADEAAKQCERANFAQIEPLSGDFSLLEKYKKENVIIYAEKYSFLNIAQAIKDVDINSPIVVVVGPEGGFSESEFDYFKSQGYKLVDLGKLIFKAPNAAVAGISNIVTRL